MDPRGTVGRIYKEDQYTLLLTKYESSGPCGFGEDFLCFSNCKSMGANDPRGGAIFVPRGMIGRIYNQRTIGPENAHMKPDLGVLSHHYMTLTLNTHTPLLT